METVIAEYNDLSAAEHAVRAVEQRGFSIQNVSIVDETSRIWRRSHPAWARRSVASNAWRAFLIGVVTSFVATQLALRIQLVVSSKPLAAHLIWAVTLAACSLSGCLSGLVSLKYQTRPRIPARFSVILRSDAATLSAVTRLFPRVRRAGYFARWSLRAGN
jgi:hypothetical protein